MNGAPATPVVEAKNLTKRFPGNHRALSGVSFTINRGEIFGLLGHNGAGKSTALGILLGMIAPDQGEILIEGIPVQTRREEALRHVGAIFETPAFYSELSGWRNLRILATYSGWWNDSTVAETVELVGLTRRIRDPVRTYSHGMRQRLALAQALLPTPRVLLLDEPTDGLDPEGIHEFRGLVRRLRDQHALTILLNSHLLSEVEQLCDRVAILKNGRLVYEGGVQPAGPDAVLYRVRTSPESGWSEAAAHCGAVLRKDGLVEFPAERDPAALPARLHSEGFRLLEFSPQHPSLEDFYLKVGAAEPEDEA